MEAEHLYPLYAISGISGSGKTTLGKSLVKEFVQMQHIDQDIYFLRSKPKAVLSDGSEVNNWDCLEALDSSFTNDVQKALQFGPVLLTGFALCRDMLPVVPTVHIHLVTADNPQDLEDRCCESRRRAKKINDTLDAMVVKELVVPFYHQMVRMSDITHTVSVFTHDGVRIPLRWIVPLAKKILKESSQPRVTEHVMDISEPYFSLIKDGKKVVEGRKRSDKWRYIRRGDTIKVTCTGVQPYTVKVDCVNLYLPSIGDPLTEYLREETLARTLPGVNDLEEGRKVYLQWSTEEGIRSYGMMAITVHPL